MTGFDIRPYHLPLKTRYRWAKGDHDSRMGLLVSAEIDGYIGWGEVAFGPHVVIDGAALSAETLRKVNAIDPASDDVLDQLDDAALHNRVRCGLATAALSAKAAAASQPLNQFLAARWMPHRQPAAAAPINGLVNKADPDEAIAQAKAYASHGMQTFKVKCGAEQATDLAVVTALRSAFPEAALRLDPNDAWKTVDNALERLTAFAPLGIDYVEDPLDTGVATLAQMAKLKESSPIAVAWDNPVDNVTAMQRLLDGDAVDVFVFKMPRTGGPDRQLEMIALAERAEKRGILTGPLESAVGTMAGLHVVTCMQPPIPDCGFSLSAHFAADAAPLPPIVDGLQAIPASTGLGIDPSSYWATLPRIRS
ncbi:MAG: hypothetical protein OXD42_14690 [Rhodospirillaceae bacterium]|nr:hypothetical protein [Rhodospirillaceae bacterium]